MLGCLIGVKESGSLAFRTFCNDFAFSRSHTSPKCNVGWKVDFWGELVRDAAHGCVENKKLVYTAPAIRQFAHGKGLNFDVTYFTKGTHGAFM